MNETAELLEYLSIVEMNLQRLMQDIRNIRSRLQATQQTRTTQQPTFFTALQADDDANIITHQNTGGGLF